MKRLANIVLNDFTNDSRVLKTSNSLNHMNFRVTVVALHNKGLKEKENIDGVEVKRIKILTRQLPKLRFFQYLKFIEFIFRAVWQFRNYDYIHCNDLNALPVGLFIKFISKKDTKVVYDCHEYETERINIKGLEKFLTKILERSLINFPDCIITVSDSIANEYVNLYKIPKPKIVLNCPVFKKQPKCNIFREKFDLNEQQKIFLYQGLFGNGRGINRLINVFSQFKDKEDVIIFMGYGPLYNKIKSAAENNINIFLHQSVDINVLLSYTSSADYGMALIDDVCLNYRYCLPNKIFEYLMAGIPFIGSNLTEMSKFIENTNTGIIAHDNSFKGIKNSINSIKKIDTNIFEKNIKEAVKIYNWEEQEKVLKNIYI